LNVEVDKSAPYDQNRSLGMAYKLRLCDHIGEKLSVVVSCRNSEGQPIFSAMPEYCGEDDFWEYRYDIKPERLNEKLTGIEHVLPLASFELEDDTGDLLFEIEVLSQDDRVLCGSSFRCPHFLATE